MFDEKALEKYEEIAAKLPMFLARTFFKNTDHLTIETAKDGTQYFKIIAINSTFSFYETLDMNLKCKCFDENPSYILIHKGEPVRISFIDRLDGPQRIDFKVKKIYNKKTKRIDISFDRNIINEIWAIDNVRLNASQIKLIKKVWAIKLDQLIYHLGDKRDYIQKIIKYRLDNKLLEKEIKKESPEDYRHLINVS